MDVETTIDESTSPDKCRLVVLGLNASHMVQSIATESGTSSKKYNMHAAVKDLLKASEERGKVFERSMEKGWSLIAKLVEKLDRGSRADRKKDEDAKVSKNEEDEEAEPRGKLHKCGRSKAKKSHRQPNKKAREGRTS